MSEISLIPSNKTKEFEEDSLPRFECTKCGSCCRDDQILVTVTSGDIIRISKALELTSPEILRVLDFYILEEGSVIPQGLEKIPSVVTERGLAYIALKKLQNGDCIFLKDDQCMIHPIRPMVCRCFPFVFNETNNERSWGLSAKKEICPGLDNGPTISATELDVLAKEILQDFKDYERFAELWNNRFISVTALDLVEEIFSIGRRVSK